MQSEWPIVPVADCCDLIVDCVNKTAPIVEAATPFRMIRTTNVRNGFIDLADCKFVDEDTFRIWTRRAKVLDGDVILTREAPIGEVGLVRGNQNIFLGQRLMQYRANRSLLDPRFLCYAFLSPQLQHQFGAHEGSGSVVSHIRVGDCSKFKVPLPPLSVQQEVAELLGSIDERVLLLRHTNATLESIAQALFKSWFIDFDPVRAKAEGREPEGMDAATAALFPEGFEESALGLIPKGWETSTLGSLCELTKGCSYKGEGLSEEDGAFMFNLGCFNAQRVFATEKVKRYTGEYRPRHAVSPGELIIANTDMTQARDILGRPALVPHGFEPGFVSHHVFKVTVRAQGSHDPAALRHYLFFTFREPTFRERAIGFATGTTVLALPASAVTDCPACIPDAASLLAWNDIVQPLFGAIRLNEARAEQLVSLRNTLLPRLISGKLRTPEAQGQVEEALA